MSELQIIAPCVHSSFSGWSGQHRCFRSRYDQVAMIALQVFGSSKIAEDWLKRPVRGLGFRAPCSLVCTPSGYDDICKLLMRLDHGILA
ncbi:MULTISPECIES: antitoxin Xre/MbcA/ParS toxin-binding domain-containing protein [Pseudomonas]|uniref:antitoxin Xre/MbcA/ParS toxin-binding domain-containing protein n=1 Tax=Pseudomonas TaxID=286 RepID=UPI0028ABA399|nr:antitoxin Xre/MbcA/ParS toxin-binding domain-containing protein [Pseudomonas qingdaonensis]